MGLRIFNIVAKLKILQNVTNITCTDKLDYQNCVWKLSEMFVPLAINIACFSCMFEFFDSNFEKVVW